MAESRWVREVTEATFEKEVVEESKARAVLVDFWATWCRPCLLLAPLLEKLVEERQGEVSLAKVNVDENPRLAASFGIESIPRVIAFRGGQPVDQFLGLLPEPQLREFLDRLRPSEAERLLDQAGALEANDPAGAEKLYRQAFADDHRSEAIRVALARVLVAQGKVEEVADLLEPVGEEGELGAEAHRLEARVFFHERARGLGDEAAARARLAQAPDSAQAYYDLGCVLAAAGRYAEALEPLLAGGERDAKLAAGPVREVMVQVFYALGADHPLANEYRGKLSQLLY